MLKRLWQSSFPFRIASSLYWAIRGARVHPSAVLLGGRGAVRLGRGAKVGSRVVLDCGDHGRIDLARRCWLSHHVEVQTAGHVTIGDGTTVQRYASVNGNVNIGRSCILAPGVFISSGTHPFRWQPHLPIREQERQMAAGSLDRPVSVHDDCWIGVHAVVAPGVTLGKGTVVGANAVVTRDWPPYSVVGGVPARALAPRIDFRPPLELSSERPDHLPYWYAGVDAQMGTSACRMEVRPGRRVEVAVPWEAVSTEVHLEMPFALTVSLDDGTALHIPPGRSAVQITNPQAAFEAHPGLRFRIAAFVVQGPVHERVHILRASSRISPTP